MIRVLFVFSFVPNLNNKRSSFVDTQSIRKSAKLERREREASFLFSRKLNQC